MIEAEIRVFITLFSIPSKRTLTAGALHLQQTTGSRRLKGQYAVLESEC